MACRSSPPTPPANAGGLIDAVVARYPLTLADPAAALVPKAVQAADQLVLVVPASADAAGSLAMTLEWLEAHGQADLTRSAVTVLNGVSVATAAYVGQGGHSGGRPVPGGRPGAVGRPDGRQARSEPPPSVLTRRWLAVVVSGLAGGRR